jgi:GcrA cell cycle regulator
VQNHQDISIDSADTTHAPFVWTQALVDELRRLVAEGLTTTQVARVLGITKNMVISKCGRSGISIPPKSRITDYSPAARARRTAAAWRRKLRRQELDSIGNLTPNRFPQRGCLWPHGHPGDKDFHFCGDRVLSDRPYCAAHAALAYRPREAE